MQIELKVPSVGESITEVEVGQWLKKEGDAVAKDESVVVIESEKTTLELPAPAAGVIGKILKQKGQTAQVGEIIGMMQQDGAPAKAAGAKPTESPVANSNSAPAPAPSAPFAEQRIMPAAARVM